MLLLLALPQLSSDSDSSIDTCDNATFEVLYLSLLMWGHLHC